MKNRALKAPLAVLAAVAAAACGDGTGVPGPETVSLNFRVSAAAPAAAPAPAPGMSLVAGPPMGLSGTNGDLTIDEIRMIINEVELKPADGHCDAVADASDDDSCPEFEAPPRFFDLPLDGEPIAAVTSLIPPGSYKALDFEVEDLEDDKGDAVEAAAIAAVRSEVLAEIPDWPREASILVTGSFTPSGGSAVSFRVFLKAEIEIEMDLVPNLMVGEDGVASRDLTVDVDPAAWFVRADDTVVPLDQYDWDATGQLLELEFEVENGFVEVEVG